MQNSRDIVQRSRIARPNQLPAILFANEYELDHNQEYLKAIARKEMWQGKPPFGMWYQVGSEWEAWCETNQPEWLGDYITVFDVDRSSMLVIRHPEELLAFGRKYGTPKEEERDKEFPLINGIKWNDVMSEYDGVEVECDFHGLSVWNLELHWYYTWDVASGVIWNTKKCISNVKVENRVPYEV